MTNDPKRLYESTEEDMTFGVGLLLMPDTAPTPCIQIWNSRARGLCRPLQRWFPPAEIAACDLLP